MLPNKHVRRAGKHVKDRGSSGSNRAALKAQGQMSMVLGRDRPVVVNRPIPPTPACFRLLLRRRTANKIDDVALLHDPEGHIKDEVVISELEVVLIFVTHANRGWTQTPVTFNVTPWPRPSFVSVLLADAHALVGPKCETDYVALPEVVCLCEDVLLW